MTTINIRVGEVFIDEIMAAEMDKYKDGECYAMILNYWWDAKKDKPQMKSLTVKVPVAYCKELMSWAEFTASASDDDAREYLALRGYARRLIRRVREQGWALQDGKLIGGLATAKSIREMAKPKKQKSVRRVGKAGWLLDELLMSDGEMDGDND